jgi:MFS family permease
MRRDAARASADREPGPRLFFPARAAVTETGMSAAAPAEVAPPHGGASLRREFGLLFACLICIGMGQSMLFSILPPAARQIGITPFQVSTIFATSASIWVFVSPAWGRRSDVAGRRRVMIVGLLGYGLSMALIATVIEIGTRQLLPALAIYPLLIASRCVFAVLGSGTGPASQAYIADRTSRTERTAGVALVSAAMGLGETIGPGLGAAFASIDILLPIFLSAALAVLSAWTIWQFLPEERHHAHHEVEKRPKMRVLDRRILPFLLVSISLQATRATTVITLAFFLQDTLKLDAAQTVRFSGIGFVVLAVSGLFSQLIIVQRFRPPARLMIRAGVALMVVAFSLLVAAGHSLAADLSALTCLGVGLGLVRPGAAAAASLAVSVNEQGSVAGMLSGISVIGNVFGPMLGTTLYSYATIGPYLLNAGIMVAMLALVLLDPRVRSVRA